MILEFGLIVVGFLCLIFGANWMIDGASILAKKLHISDIVIGLTVVAFGTSAPELVVNSIASLNNHSDIILGNIIGSNSFNTFVILGIVGLIYPIAVPVTTIKKEIPISLGVLLLFIGLSNDFFIRDAGFLSRIDGLILLILFVGFMYYISKNITNETPPEISEDTLKTSNIKTILLIVVGLGGLLLGGKLVVDNAVYVAEQLGISQKIIGLTIVAAGTSLPELVTSVVAAMKKNSDIAIGNVIGSNIFNLLLIIPTSLLIQPFAYNTSFNVDLIMLTAGTLFLILSMFIGNKYKLDRWQSAILLFSFIGYTIYQII